VQSGTWLPIAATRCHNQYIRSKIPCLFFATAWKTAPYQHKFDSHHKAMTTLITRRFIAVCTKANFFLNNFNIILIPTRGPPKRYLAFGNYDLTFLCISQDEYFNVLITELCTRLPFIVCPLIF
jgi:hypothetical protein